MSPASTKPVIQEIAKIESAEIHGAKIQYLHAAVDSRGKFTEVFSHDWNPGIDPVQWSYVRSESRVLRGMYLHLRHDEYFVLLEGNAIIGLYDARTNSPTYRNSLLFEISCKRPAYISFPRGVIHGWYFPKPSSHLQAVSESYGRYKDDDNLGCRWDDPDLNINWPDRSPVISDRSRSLPWLKDLIEEIGFR